MTHRLVAIAAMAGMVAAAAACRPLGEHTRTAAVVAPSAPAAIERGAATYGAYCAGCHGPTGAGDGPFAAALGFAPADLRGSTYASVSDEALLDRLIRGTPLEIPPVDRRRAESYAVDALTDYLPRLASADWNVLRAGRVVYDGACAPCHGAYGRADTAIAPWLGAPDLIVARERVSDRALVRISEAGTGQMPPLLGAFDPAELAALTAYVRYLSDGFAIYDMRCAACHGDDGQGLYTRDLIPPAIAAPSLRASYPRERLVAMLRRERGVMPHFRELDESRMRDVIAYLRAAIFQSP